MKKQSIHKSTSVASVDPLKLPLASIPWLGKPGSTTRGQAELLPQGRELATLATRSALRLSSKTSPQHPAINRRWVE